LKTSTCLPNRPPRALTDSVLPVPAGPYGLPPRPIAIPVIYSGEIEIKKTLFTLCRNNLDFKKETNRLSKN
jgi:hypothetical protein